MPMHTLSRIVAAALLCAAELAAAATTTTSIAVPAAAPTSAMTVDPSLLSVSLEFFTFPSYTELSTTTNCLANLQTLRGAPPAVRIGGTTQDRARYNASLPTAVQYTVPAPTDAPDALAFGPSFFTLAAALKGDVTLGLNRQLNNMSNTAAAATQAQSVMKNLLSIELGNEPEFYNSSSAIIPKGQSWSPTTDGASQASWITALAPSLGNIFQAAVYLQLPTWSTAGLIPRLGSAIAGVKTFSGHSYPQSACGGASTNLTQLMSHAGIVSYTRQYAAEAAAAHAQGKRYFLGETNSATCGGGGISPTFGAALWITDYVLQGALNGVERMYFHQGTLGACAYCFWGNASVAAPYLGAAFVSDFLGTAPGARIAMLDAGTGALGAYALFPAAGAAPTRVLLTNSAFFDGSTARSSASVALAGLPAGLTGAKAKRMTAPAATSTALGTGGATIGGAAFDTSCRPAGTQALESVVVKGGVANVTLMASEALIVYL